MVTIFAPQNLSILSRWPCFRYIPFIQLFIVDLKNIYMLWHITKWKMFLCIFIVHLSYLLSKLFKPYVNIKKMLTVQKNALIKHEILSPTKPKTLRVLTDWAVCWNIVFAISSSIVCTYLLSYVSKLMLFCLFQNIAH